MWAELRFAIRRLTKEKWFTVAGIGSLTLGISAVVCCFSLVDGILLRPLPVKDADQLIVVSAALEDGSLSRLSYSAFKALQARTTTLERVAAVTTRLGYREGSDGERQAVTYKIVSGDYFSILGATAAVGTLVRSEQGLPDGTLPAVISEAYWRQEYGAVDSVLGSTLQLQDQTAMTVVGVLSELAEPFPELGTASFWSVPTLPSRTAELADLSGEYFVIGRLSAGRDRRAVQAELGVLTRSAEEAGAESDGGRVATLTARSLLDTVLGVDARRTIWLFTLVVTAVFSIAVLNVIALQAARVSKRQRDLSVQLALGASRWAVMRSAITDSSLIALVGGLCGFLLAYIGSRSLLTRLPRVLPRWDNIEVGINDLGVALILALVAAVPIALIPALRGSRADVSTALRRADRAIFGSRSERWLQRSTTAAQTALGVTLLIGAGLLLQSFVQLISVNVGFDPEGLVIERMSLPSDYDDSARRRIADDVLERVRLEPSVTAAAIASYVPMVGRFGGPIEPEGAESIRTGLFAATSDYPEAMRIALLQGRWFSEIEVSEGTRVAVVSQLFARQAWPDESALGQRLRYPSRDWLTVIGVVDDTRDRLREGMQSAVYVPYASGVIPRMPGERMNVIVRADGAPIGIEEVVEDIEPDAETTVLPIAEAYRLQTTNDRVYTITLVVLAVAGIGLAALGVYSLVAIGVAQRLREAAIRTVCGAEPNIAVIWAMRTGAVPGLIGVFAGLLAAAGVSRFLDSVLFEVDPVSPRVYVIVGTLACLVVLCAAWLPARKVATLDPMAIFRCE